MLNATLTIVELHLDVANAQDGVQAPWGVEARSAGLELFYRVRAAPAWQISGVVCFCQGKRLGETLRKIFADLLRFDAVAEKIRLLELAEGDRNLGETSGAPQFGGEAAERIVFHFRD